jgi:Amt family ammonium transporter
MKRNVTETELELDMLKGNIDCFFLIVMGCIVFLMQCGFAFLEAGSVR